MPKSSATKHKRSKAVRSTVVRRRAQGGARRKNGTFGGRLSSVSEVVCDGLTTHVLVPLDEYERLVMRSMVHSAIEKLESGDDDWVDADDFGLELAGAKLAAARKAAGLTQKQLGEKLSLPQSQISRIERNPDRTTVRTLKRIAKALGVNVAALLP